VEGEATEDEEPRGDPRWAALDVLREDPDR
jgi:hypothetical protein